MCDFSTSTHVHHHTAAPHESVGGCVVGSSPYQVLSSQVLSSECVSLGISAKYYSAPSDQRVTVDRETGEILDDGQAYDSTAARLERFALQSAARRLLRYTNVSRVARCLRVRLPQSEVEVFRSRNHDSACYGGLQTCGSVWVCPVCAAKISERRRVELLHAIERHREDGGEVLLLTLTTPHSQWDDLAEMLQCQADALRRFNCSRAAQRLNREIGCIGQVRALEVTHGRLRSINNGWHPHYHILLFVRSGLDLEDLRRRYYQRWLRACELAGLPLPTYDHGVTLQDGRYAAEYASKWGLDREMTKGHIKRGRNGGETPFDLLRAYLYDEDLVAARLFREFAEAFKGKRQLHWSRGLKRYFAIEELTDEELADYREDDAERLGAIELEDWRRILARDLRGEVLELARRGGWDAVERLLRWLRINVTVTEIPDEENRVFDRQRFRRVSGCVP